LEAVLGYLRHTRMNALKGEPMTDAATGAQEILTHFG
jgi:hypothetical protein